MIQMNINLSPVTVKEYQFIQTYGDETFRISDIRYEGSVIVFPKKTIQWGVVSPESITIDSLKPIIFGSEKIRILLIGCGQEYKNLEQGIDSELRNHGIFCEWMNTGAACRTFNVLMAEARDAAAALIAI
ncbi:MAG: hypothetical protein CMF70_09440 [Magnetovibrio sp.]|nr:hypothetical protein [Magnetovibrio sp.]